MNTQPRIIFERTVLLTLALLMCSCATDPSYTEAEKQFLSKSRRDGAVIGTLAGGVLGAGIGALSGNSSNILKSAAIGAAAGAGTGFVVGRAEAERKILQLRIYNRELDSYINKLRLSSDELKGKKAKPTASEVKKKIAVVGKIDKTLSSQRAHLPSATASDRSLKLSFSHELNRLRDNKEQLEQLYAVQFSPPSDDGDQKEGTRGGRRSLDDGGPHPGNESSEGSIGGRHSLNSKSSSKDST